MTYLGRYQGAGQAERLRQQAHGCTLGTVAITYLTPNVLVLCEAGCDRRAGRVVWTDGPPGRRPLPTDLRNARPRPQWQYQMRPTHRRATVHRRQAPVKLSRLGALVDEPRTGAN